VILSSLRMVSRSIFPSHDRDFDHTFRIRDLDHIFRVLGQFGSAALVSSLCTGCMTADSPL